MNIKNIIESVNSDPKRFLFIFLAIFPTIMYIGWSIKQLVKTIISNTKGGEYK